MRIGFASLFSWRPHVEHLFYLASLAREAGHDTFFLACDSDLPNCYTHEMRPDHARWLQCVICRAGGIRSYTGRGVTSIGDLRASPDEAPARAAEWSRSSAGTLGRYESNAEFAGEALAACAARLDPAVRLAYAAARRWIDRERLDALCLFNGRKDITRAVMEAARDAGISYITMERTWFGDGMQLLPQENCLGLASVDRLMAQWRDVPLDRAQAMRAVGHVASRFLRRNSKEWRAYNLQAAARPWPVQGGRRRLLITPGSRNEVWGHADWRLGWPEMTAGYDALIDHLALQPADLVLRCHPNWGERIHGVDGSRSERYFTEWAQRRGIHVIASRDNTSTLDLIGQSDAIVLAGGSAALEAGILGKQVIALGPSVYQQAGLQTSAYDERQLASLQLHVDLPEAQRARESERIRRQTLRMCHTMVYRIAQFVPYVRCITTTQYEYLQGADPGRLTRLLATRSLEADDATATQDDRAENEILDAARRGDWASLAPEGPDSAVPQAGPARPVRRRWLFRPVDQVRAAMPRGDL